MQRLPYVFTLRDISYSDILYTPTRQFLRSQDSVAMDYGGYAYVLLPVGVNDTNRGRYKAACEEFLARFFESSSDRIGPPNTQVLTIWMVRTFIAHDNQQCDQIVNSYDYDAARRVAQSLHLDNVDGPVLVAAKNPYQQSVRQQYLILDMSGRTESDVREGMRVWYTRMRMGPETWNSGWRLENFRLWFRDRLSWFTDALLRVSS